MSKSSELWTQLKAAEAVEQAATVAHDAAELLGSRPAYTVAFEAMADSRAALKVAQDAYKTAVQAEECADLGFEKCEFSPDDDACECCKKQNLQLFFQGPDDAGRYFCAACVIAEKTANDNYAPVAK